MFVDVPIMRMMKMAVMQIIDMIAVAHSCMAAAFSVFVVVVVMDNVVIHGSLDSAGIGSSACSMALRIISTTWLSARE